MVKRFCSSVALTLALGLLVISLAGCTQQAQADPTPTAAPAAPGRVTAGRGVSAEAYFTPLQQVDLAFKRGGRVAEVLVKEGAGVQAGQVVARLEDAEVRAAVAQAEAALARTQAQLAATKAGPTTAQVAQAQAAVARAEAALAQTKSGATEEAVAVAQARVNTLQAQLANALAGPRPESIEASSTTVFQAEAAVKVAQSNYDRVAGNAEVMVREPAALALQDATFRYQAAKANHQALLKGSTPSEVAILRAQVAEGQAALKQAQAGPTSPAIAQSEAALAEARAALEGIKAGTTPEQIAVSAAAVKEAEAALQAARVSLADVELKAPFAGIVATLNLDPGQYVGPGATVLNLADLSGWQIETDNLTEIEVVRVKEGQAVQISVDALPGETLQGTVTRIKPRSERKSGDVTYTVVVDLKSPDPRLRWGMTTSLVFATE